MANFLNDISDNEIRFIGANKEAIRKQQQRKQQRKNRILVAIGFFALLLITLIILLLVRNGKSTATITTMPEEEIIIDTVQEDLIFESEPTPADIIVIPTDSVVAETAVNEHSFIEIKDTVINDIPLKIFIPHNAEMSLQIGADPNDRSIIFATQAADIRADNLEINNQFVLKGEVLTRGKSKRGYCAIINGKVTIGVGDSAELFEAATETCGYFFRQYPLVDNGKLVENKPKGKSFRRAVCDRNGEIFMVQSSTRESFHDFAQALVDLGVDNAIYTVGSLTYSWALDKNGNIKKYGVQNYDFYEIANSRDSETLSNTNYLVWRKKQ